MNHNAITLPKGILFDMDGVLLVTTQSSNQSWQHVCQQFASTLGVSPETLYQFLSESRDAYQRDIENDVDKQQRDRLEPFATRRETVEKALEHIGKKDTLLASEMVRAYEILREKHLQPSPHTLDVLRAFQKHAIPLALISNGNATYQRHKIKLHHLAPFFTTILIEGEFGVAKPDQRIFLAALDHLHVPAQETWMIGDNLALDIAGSQQLGIFAIWFDPSQKGLPQESIVRPDRIIHTLTELLDENK